MDIILGIPEESQAANQDEFPEETRENLQLGFEPARRALKKRANEQENKNSQMKLYPVIKPGQKVLMYRPYQDSEGPNPKLQLPWRGPFTVSERMSPTVYRIKLDERSNKEVSVHLAHLKKYNPRETPPAPDFDKLSELFLGKSIPLPEVDQPDEKLPRIEKYVIEKVVGHAPGPGRRSRYNFKYRLRLKGFGPATDLTNRAEEVPQCQHLIEQYRRDKGLDRVAMPDSSSASNRKRKR